MKTSDKAAMIAFAALGLIWGSNFISMKLAAAHISPVQIVFLRVLFGFAPILLLALWRGELRARHLRHWRHFAVMSLLATVIYYYAFAHGAALLPSGIAGMLSGAIPLFTFVLTALLTRSEPITRRRMFGVTLGFLGVVLIARPWSNGTSGLDLRGVGYMALGSLSIGSSFVYAKRYMAKLDIPPLALSTYQIGFALCVLTAITPFAGLEHIGDDRVALAGLVLGLGLIGTGIAYVLYYFIVQRMGAVQASTVTYLPPIVAPLIGCVLMGESLTALDFIAMVSILSGVYAAQSQGRAVEQVARALRRWMGRSEIQMGSEG
jgi:drug/metabolite transporter (DMT)-like permease